MSRKIIKILGFCAFLLSGCASNPPAWFLSQKPSNDIFYGFGSDKNIAKAKQEAINDLAQNIQTTITSSTNITNNLKDDTLSSSLSQNIRLDVAALDLQNLKISKNDYIKNTYYVRVEIHKKDIIAPLLQYYKKSLDSIQNINSTCKSLSLYDFTKLQKQLTKINDLSSLIFIIDSANHAKLPDSAHFKALLAKNLPTPKIKVEFKTKNISQSDLNPISGEIAKFFTISNQDDIHTLFIDANLQDSKDGFILIVDCVMKDCEGNVIFQTSINEHQKTKENTIKRAGVVLHKKILEYKNGNQSNIPKIN